MIQIKADPNNRSFYVKVDSLTRHVQRGIRQAYFKIGKGLKAYTIKDMKSEKHGRTYGIVKVVNMKVGPGRKTIAHIASAPGESPAIVTKRLMLSLNFEVRGWTELEYGANTPYARALEMGDPKRNLEARPYLLPAIDKTQGAALEHFNTEIEKALK